VAVVFTALVVASLPAWLPRAVVALRMWLFARINGSEGLAVPGDVVDGSRFLELYGHPAARGRSRGAALSDLFWYWLSPGAEVHQEHLEAGPRYDEVARCTRRIVGVPRAAAEALAEASLDALPAVAPAGGVVHLRDLVMPVWAELYHRLVFGRPAPDEVRDLIVGNATDVVTALKCCGLRHMDRRLRLTDHLERVLDEIPHELPSRLSRREQALYVQGTFFNTAVVQSSEATAHLLMALAADPDHQRAAMVDGAALDAAFEETLGRFPLFGVAHRVTTDDIGLDGRTIPAGSVLCFNYPEHHRAGGHIPFGVSANRPCPAAHLAPVTIKVVTRRLLGRFELATTASHTRALPNRGPCLLSPRGAVRSWRRPARLALLREGDRWAGVGRGVTQLVFGTWMVWEARRLRLCATYFEQFPETQEQPS
jgi:hypothetical protein